MNKKALNLEYYKKVYLIRRAEQGIIDHYMEDDMKTPMHMSMGSEAIVVGVCHELSPGDSVLGTYRSHALYLAKTGDTDGFFAEMYGKASGAVGGKGGSMHLTAPKHGMIATSAVVASTIPLALGVAFVNKMKETGGTVAVFFGDGAIDEGVFWESLNSACLMRLPVLFVCEDNGLAIHTPPAARHGYDSISAIVKQFNCSVFTETTTDVEVIASLTRQALKSMADTGRPAFMHLKYYRYLEHVGVFEDFKSGYRPQEEYQQWRKVDPIDLQRKKLPQWYPEEEIKEVEGAIDAQVIQSIEKAKAAPFPEPEATFEHLFA